VTISRLEALLPLVEPGVEAVTQTAPARGATAADPVDDDARAAEG
jgi:hypothetical protein